MKIAMIGTGYVGLVSGAGFAELGNEVCCVDNDAARIERLRRGQPTIQEPGLPELLHHNTALGRLTFTTSIADAVAGAPVVFIAVGTPSAPDGSVDLDQVLAAARAIGAAIDGFTVVVTKCTVPVGTADRVRAEIARTTRHPFAVAANPEFLKEGDAVADFMKPARVIVGADDRRAVELLTELYRTVLRTSDRMLVMDIRSAELTKYAANAMLATRISFMNELAQLAEVVGADIEEVRLGIGSDPRIGNKYLFAGCGFGGSCFGKDLRALAHAGRSHDVHLTVVDAVADVNARQRRSLGRHVISYFGGSLAGKRIAVWGLAFKPDTDDLREAPALDLIEQLRAARGEIAAYDPIAMPNARALLGDAVTFAPDPYAATVDADALVLVTEWHELRQPDWRRLAQTMRGRALFDGRNQWEPTHARGAGFVYRGVGRGSGGGGSRGVR